VIFWGKAVCLFVEIERVKVKGCVGVSNKRKKRRFRRVYWGICSRKRTNVQKPFCACLCFSCSSVLPLCLFQYCSPLLWLLPSLLCFLLSLRSLKLFSSVCGVDSWCLEGKWMKETQEQAK